MAPFKSPSWSNNYTQLADCRNALPRSSGLLSGPFSLSGWDHGVFIPFLLINPAADIPIVQVSVLESEDPVAHFRMGAALSKLRDSNIAIVGSGFASFHNLGILRRLRVPTNQADLAGFRARSDIWNVALSQAVSRPTRAERLASLRCWRGLPHSFEMHPSGGGEHFMPLLVCASAANDDQAHAYTDRFMGINIITYFWGEGSPDR